MTTVAVIAPDLGSGEDFTKVARACRPDVDWQLKKVDISPRVEGNQLTSQPEKVSIDLAEALEQASVGGTDFVTIACNTLSLPIFVKPALKMISNQDLKLILTVQEIKKFQFDHKHSVLIGTTPLTSYLAKTAGNKYKTLFAFTDQADHWQDMVQEIIWRVKAWQGSDISTADKYLPGLDSDENFEYLISLVKKLDERLCLLPVSEIILACTELPVAFGLISGALKYSLVDPAELVASRI